MKKWHKNELLHRITEDIYKLRKSKPLVHHITNKVTIRDSANVTLSLGASPIMADNPEEIREIAVNADSIVLNTGTLSKNKDKFYKIIEVIKENDKPVILDPVGVAVSSVRKKLVMELLDTDLIDIVKGNIAEIGELVGIPARSKGVDSEEKSIDEHKLYDIEISASRKFNSTIIITGEKDLIVNKEASCSLYIKNGDPLFSKITGAGCMLTSVIGSFMGIENNILIAGTAGLLVTGIAGEIAGEKAEGPGSFTNIFLDEIYNMTGEKINERAQVDVINSS